MTRVYDAAVVGAGPAGSFAAERLAAAGRSVVLFDPKGAWEKPCGGGVPSRALDRYAFLSEDPVKQTIERVTLIGPSRRRVAIDLEKPLVIYSREWLNGLLLARTRAAGAEFVKEPVARFEREGDVWRVETREGAWLARLLVGADGAVGVTRKHLTRRFVAEDFAAAVGYNARGGGTSEVVVDFPADFTGYLWAFPRPDHTNFGIANRARENTSERLKALLHRFMDEYYGGEPPELERYGAKLPMLLHGSWEGLRATGDGWALVGDAAGFVDPITGEGIYFAMRSSELLVDALVDGSGLPGYECAWWEDFGRDLAHAARYADRFYRGRFLGAPVLDRALQLAAYHPGFRRVVRRALGAEQSYERLKLDLTLAAVGLG